jgi:formylglycine-generating enzyme required for sulfatase activity
MAVVFISHATPDDGLATSLSAWLQAEGFGEPFVDHERIVGGSKWMDALRASAGACRLVICLVTPRWLERDDFCIGEWRAAWLMGKGILPLFVLGDETELGTQAAQHLAKVRTEDQGIDVAGLIDGDRFDFARDPQRVEALKRALRFAGVLVKVGPDPGVFDIDRDRRPSPFPGLASFGDDDADAALFYGRGREIAESLEALREMRAKNERRPLVILGASGSGKSSLLKAGIIPRLRRDTLAWLPLRAFRPGADPLLNFAEAWTRTLGDYGLTEAYGALKRDLFETWEEAERDEDGELTLEGRATLTDRLEREATRLRQTANRPKATLLLSVDQAEEIARSDGPSGDALADYLREALESQGAWQLALTIRTDSFPELQRHPRFRDLETRGYDLRALQVYRFDNVVELPAQRYEVEVELALVDALMEDAPSRDALPLLAFGLQRLWDQFAAAGCLGEADYRSMGGLTGLIEDAAERALLGVPAEEPRPPRRGHDAVDRLGARTFVPALVDLNDDGEPIRRVAVWSDFDDEVQAVLERFDRWRLVVRKVAAEGADTVEVAHEALLREWGRLKEWLEPERGRLEALRALQFQAATWHRRGRSREDLGHRGQRLKEALPLVGDARYRPQLSETETAYLQACQGRQQAENRWWQGTLVTAAILVMFSLGAWWKKEAIDALWFDYWTVQPFIARDVEPYVHSAEEVLALPLVPTSTFSDCRSGCPEMVVVPTGTVAMGDERDEWSFALPVHRVTIEHRFAVSTTEVTFEQWDRCAELGGCRRDISNSGWDGGRRPVIQITWNEAKRYAAWLSRVTDQPYRLLTEAEWEYVARAGSRTKYSWGDDVGRNQANCDGCGSKWDNEKTAPVKSFSPNAFGLYDVHGNVWEWVEDCWHETYEGAPDDGSPWMEDDGGDCIRAVVRGGSWYYDPQSARSASRFRFLRDNRKGGVGFRVARTLPVRQDGEP